MGDVDLRVGACWSELLANIRLTEVAKQHLIVVRCYSFTKSVNKLIDNLSPLCVL